MRPDASPLRAAAAVVVASLWTVATRTTAALRHAAALSWRLLLWLATTLRALASLTVRTTHRLLAGPVRRTLVGPVRTALLGQRTDASLLVALSATVLAAGTAWWVAADIGYGTLEAAARGTWTGTDPAWFLLLAVGVVLALGTVSAAVNSGLVPTTVLTAAPAFGAAVTRYGTTESYSWGTTVVSLPEAVGVAALVAVAAGVPLGTAAFLLGSALRRMLAVFDPGTGPRSPVDEA